MIVAKPQGADLRTRLLGWDEIFQRHTATLPKEQRDATEESIERQSQETLVTTSTGNEIKAGK